MAFLFSFDCDSPDQGDGGLVLTPIVQHRLAAAPVVAVTPVIDQRLDLGERGALGPVVDCLRVRPAGLVDAAVEGLEVRLRDGEDEGVMASLGMDFFSVS